MTLSSYMALNELRDTNLEYDISPIPYMKSPQTLAIVIGVAIAKGIDVNTALREAEEASDKAIDAALKK